MAGAQRVRGEEAGDVGEAHTLPSGQWGIRESEKVLEKHKDRAEETSEGGTQHTPGYRSQEPLRFFSPCARAWILGMAEQASSIL